MAEAGKTARSGASSGALTPLLRHRAIAAAFAVVVVLFAVGTIHSSGFASGGQLRTLLIYASFIGLTGLGQTLCILTGGIDLSIPATMSGAAIMTTDIASKSSLPLAWVIVIVLLMAIGVGLINGLGIAYAAVPPIIMTLGTGGAVQGLLLVITEGGITQAPPAAIQNFVDSSVAGIPTIGVIWFVAIAVGCLLLSGTSLGRKIYAVGTNARAAYLAGIEVKRVLVVPYVISAFSAAIAGLLLMGFVGQAFLAMGEPYLFASAAAVAVGGASILGGSGHYVGTVAGALVLTLVTALLPLFNLGQAWLQIGYGLILLVTVFIGSRAFARRRVA